MKYYEINEETARLAHEMMSMSDYRKGSATAEYRASVDQVAALAEKRKSEVNPFYHDKIDALLDSCARKLAGWTNDHNRNGASCPSIMISGGSNFPTRKKEKQNAREESLWREYDSIKEIPDKIRQIGSGPVDLADPHAREMLTEQLTAAQNRLDLYKAVNAWWRKHKTATGCPGLTERAAASINETMVNTSSLPHIYNKPFPEYELSSAREKIKRIQARLAKLDKLDALKDDSEGTTKFDGGEIVRNAELNRLQIVFDDIPDPDTRAALKSESFRWPPKNKAWQRQLTANAERAARRVLNLV